MSNNSALQTFDFNTHALRVIIDEHGEPWFIAKDVAEILNYSDAHKMTSRLDDDEKSNRKISGLGSPTGGRGTLTINESGLYSSILGSNKPEAKAFKKHVTSEILPAIRKTGSYQKNQSSHAKYTQTDLFNNITIDKDHYIDLLRYRLNGLQTPRQIDTPPPLKVSPHRKRRWTEEEITQLHQLYDEGASYRVISNKLNKTLTAIKYAIHIHINSKEGV